MQRSRSSPAVQIQVDARSDEDEIDNTAGWTYSADKHGAILSQKKLKSYGIFIYNKFCSIPETSSELFFRIFLVLALVVFCFLCDQLFRWFQEEQRGIRYAVFIDAGSTGSRVHVYKYTPARWPDYSLVTLPDDRLKVEPGLSTYASSPTGAGHSLMPLLEYGYSKVPAAMRGSTPIRLMATAGLRLLPEHDVDAILTECRRVLARSQFKFRPSWVEVISGDREGIYGWVAVNYVSGALQRAATTRSSHTSLPHHGLHGVLEMGGASVQITFLHDDHTSAATSSAVSSLKLPGVAPPLFTHSYLGYGLDVARMKTEGVILSRGGPQPEDPCLPPGLVLSDKRTGAGNFSACHQLVAELVRSWQYESEDCVQKKRLAILTELDNLHKEHIAEDTRVVRLEEVGLDLEQGGGGDVRERKSPVAQEGVAEGEEGLQVPCTPLDPSPPPVQGRFVAMENFFWVAKALGLSSGASLVDLVGAAQHFCETPWEELQHQHGQLAPSVVMRNCFGATYIWTLLSTFFGFVDDTPKINFTNSLAMGGGGPQVGLDWPLGALVVEVAHGQRGFLGGLPLNSDRAVVVAGCVGLLVVCLLVVYRLRGAELPLISLERANSSSLA